MNIKRGIGALTCALIGGFLIVSAVFSPLDVFNNRDARLHPEFEHHFFILIVIWVVMFVIGAALLYGAWRLCRNRRAPD
jgi:hypothetical protein